MSACAQPPAAGDARFTRQPQADAQDRITLTLPARAGGACTLTITQRFGIGAARVALSEPCRHAALTLRFRHAPGQPFVSLEMLQLSAGAEPQQPSRDALRATPDALELDLPATWLQGALGAPAAIELSWIDAYRG